MQASVLRNITASLLVTLLAASASYAQDVPTIRFARTVAAEDNLWLMLAKPELAPNMGKLYKVEWSQYRGSDTVFKAYEAGQIDLFSTPASPVIVAASTGLNLKIIASVTREARGGAVARLFVKSDGPRTVADLKGTTIGIIGFRGSIETWTRKAIKSAGLNPDRDVTWAPMPFAAMVDAVRAGKISTGGTPEPFGANEIRSGEFRVLLTSRDVIPFDEELIVVSAKPEFLQKHPEAVRAFITDLVATTKYYESHLRESRQAIIDAKLVAMPPDVYFNMPDHVHAPGLKPSIDLLNKQQDFLIAEGLQEHRIDINSLVDLSFVGN